jgi:hypothetical protein
MEAYLKTTIHATLLFIYILYIHWLANFLIHHVLIILFFVASQQIINFC